MLVLILLYPLYMLGMLGAGDIKLYCMSAAYLAGKDYIIFFLCSLLFSAIAAFLKMLFLGNLWERIHYFYLYAVDVAKKKRRSAYDGSYVNGVCAVSLHCILGGGLNEEKNTGAV